MQAAPHQHSTHPLAFLAITLIAGILLVVSIPFHQYPYQRGTAIGFPFFASWYDESGRDFVGGITLPALLGDAVVWFLVPQLVLAYRVRRDLRSDGENPTNVA